MKRARVDLSHVASLGEQGALRPRRQDAGMLEGFRQLFRQNGEILTVEANQEAPEPGAWRALAADAAPTVAKVLGAAITAARERAGIASQSELARRIGARPEHVGRWERGDHVAPTLATLVRIARVTGPIEATLPGGSVLVVGRPAPGLQRGGA